MTVEGPFWDAAVKLLAAVALSVPLGLERERKERPAGLRTHVLVCLGSTLMMVVSEMIVEEASRAGLQLDRGRIAAGVITGIGFLGAGTIFTVGPDQHGLTTAAMIWFVAALGIAIGAGYIGVAAVVAGLALALVIGLEWVERWLPKKHRLYRLRVRVPEGVQALPDLERVMSEAGFKAEVSEIVMGGGEVEASYTISTRRDADVASMAKTISERYERAHKVVITR